MKLFSSPNNIKLLFGFGLALCLIGLAAGQGQLWADEGSPTLEFCVKNCSPQPPNPPGPADPDCVNKCMTYGNGISQCPAVAPPKGPCKNPGQLCYFYGMASACATTQNGLHCTCPAP